MQACVLTKIGLRFDADYPSPVPQDGMVPVRVVTAGVCETDLQLIMGYMGFQGVLGHEFVGVAEDGPFAGRRVVGEINCACHACDLCRDGMESHCPNRTVIGILNHDGAFAETVMVPHENLHLVPDNVSDDEAVFTEPLAAAFQIPAQLNLDAFNRVIVLGDGRLGNLCAQVISHAGCHVTVVGKHAAKLAVLDELGVNTAHLSDLVFDRTADLVVDCTGSSTGLETACRLVRPRGTIVLKTTVAGDTGPSLASVVIDEITIVGSRCGPFDVALKALKQGDVHVAPLISARFPLKEIDKAINAARTAPNLKVLLDVSTS